MQLETVTIYIVVQPDWWDGAAITTRYKANTQVASSYNSYTSEMPLGVTWRQRLPVSPACETIHSLGTFEDQLEAFSLSLSTPSVSVSSQRDPRNSWANSGGDLVNRVINYLQFLGWSNRDQALGCLGSCFRTMFFKELQVWPTSKAVLEMGSWWRLRPPERQLRLVMHHWSMAYSVRVRTVRGGMGNQGYYRQSRIR